MKRKRRKKDEGIFGEIAIYSTKYFGVCAFSGAFCCGLTHYLMTPIDIVKCNMQALPNVFPTAFKGFSDIYRGEENVRQLGHKRGILGLLKGWGPTIWGYSIQGACKFGIYEYLKYEISKKIGDKNAIKYRDLVYLSSALTAEFFGDIALCPLEAIKVRIQLNPNFARGMIDGLPKFVREEGFANLFSGIGPLWARQIPYTVIKFVAFERISEFIYSKLSKPKSDLSIAEQMGVVFASGYLSGVFCAVASHPADILVSKINAIKTEGNIWSKSNLIYKEIGFSGFWKGIYPRTFMIGTLAAAQWFIYSSIKSIVGLPIPGNSKEDIIRDNEEKEIGRASCRERV